MIDLYGKLLRTLSHLILTLAVSSAQAQTMVELFTSEGCYTCSSADEYLRTLTARDNLIGLSFHIDYWDYLGWKDTQARAEFTTRQVGYQERYQSKQLYTPQFVIAGSASLDGADLAAVESAIEIAPPGEEYLVEVSDGILKIKAGEVEGNYSVMLAHVISEAVVEITDGENAGRTLTYSNVVKNLENLGTWNGVTDFSVELPNDDGLKLVLFIQSDNLGPITYATELN